jgi:hypothetical protein
LGKERREGVSNNPGVLPEKAVFPWKITPRSGQEETQKDPLCYNFRDIFRGSGDETKMLILLLLSVRAVL